MLEHIKIVGGGRLTGSISVSGAKNAALPLLIATLVSSERCVLSNLPRLDDIAVTLRLLKSLGAEVDVKDDTVSLEVPEISKIEAPYSLVKALRASFWVFGPILARTGRAQVSLPGGDAIGVRPVDLHLRGLAKLGAEIRMRHGVVFGEAPGGLRGGKFEMEYPSVGATIHLLITAALIDGETELFGAAREPEIINIANYLLGMGACIEGAGTGRIYIRGKKELGGASAAVMGDRIEAVTYLLAGAMTKGDVSVSGITAADLGFSLTAMEQMGVEITAAGDEVRAGMRSELKSVNLETAPYPGLATDVQPLFMAALSIADGESSIRETVFESRFRHVAEYRRFGANINIKGDLAIIKGARSLSGAPVQADDIRGAAGLVLLGLVADGVTTIHEIHHLDRGYEQLISRMKSLGAEVERVPAFDESDIVYGC